MSSPNPTPSWKWSPSRKQYYYFDPRRNLYVFQDGTRQAVPGSSESARAYPGEPRTMPTETQQDSSGRPGFQNPQYEGYAASSSVLPQQGAEMMARLQNMQLQSNVSTGMSQPNQPRVQFDNIQERTDRDTGVTTKIGYGPSGEKALLGTRGDQEKLDSSYQIRSDPRKFFTVGKVFLTLWTEPSTRKDVTFVTPVKYGEGAYCQIRRFVVVREGTGYCNAVPILTYGGRGLSKPGVVASEHALVYTGKVPPKLLDSDAGIMELALRIDPVSNEDTLTETSRINLAKVYTIEHNLKVKPVGTVIDRNGLLRGVLQAREQQPQPRKKNPEIGRPSNNDSRGGARRPSGQGTATTSPRNISGGASRGGTQSQSSVRRGAGSMQLGRTSYQTQDSRQEEEESEEDEDDEDEDEDESSEEADSDDDDPRNKQPQRKSSQQSSQARRGYNGSQRTQGQYGYQYSQR